MAKATSNTTTTKATANGKPKGKKAAAPAVERAPRAKKEGLRKAQVRILEVLKKVGVPLNRNDLMEKAKIDPAWLYHFVGPTKPETQARTGVKPLTDYGFVKLGTVEVTDGKTENTVAITAAGKQGLEKHLKAESAKSA
jgi:hypothetical protein